ncbi:MAG: lysostaphin resistance A-like protein [Lachnospiraceae bacterium]
MLSAFLNELLGAILQLFAFSIIPFIWWLITARKHDSFFGWIGLKKITHEKKVTNTLLSIVLAAISYSTLTYLCICLISDEITTAGSQFAGMGITAVPAAFAYAYIRTGLAEEIVFRGFILKRIKNRFGFAAGNLIQAVLFGLLHGLPFGMVTRNIVVTVLFTILPGAFGWYQGWLNEKRCGESIIPSWLLHGTMNFIVTCLSL